MNRGNQGQLTNGEELAKTKHLVLVKAANWELFSSLHHHRLCLWSNMAVGRDTVWSLTALRRVFCLKTRSAETNGTEQHYYASAKTQSPRGDSWHMLTTKKLLIKFQAFVSWCVYMCLPTLKKTPKTKRNKNNTNLGPH